MNSKKGISIPSELKWKVMEFLPLGSIAHCLLVDRGFYEFWKFIYETQFKDQVGKDDFQFLLKLNKTYRSSMRRTREIETYLAEEHFETICHYSQHNIKEIRIRVLGVGGVGKSSICNRYFQDRFEDDVYTPNIEYSLTKEMQFRGKKLHIDVYDAAGQEEYATLRDSYIKGGDGFVFVYSITERQSFEELDEFYEQAMMVLRREEFIPFVLVGNKSDLDTAKNSEREVDVKQGIALARKWSIPFMETSAKDNIHVDEIFETVLKEVFSIKNLRELVVRRDGREAFMDMLQKNGPGGTKRRKYDFNRRVKSKKCSIM